MTMIVVPAEPHHLPVLAENLRDADRAELAAAGHDPADALVESYAVSDPDMCWTALVDGEPVAIWGAARLDDVFGSAWLLTAKKLETVKREAWVASVEYVRKMHSRYPVLFNYVDARNVVSRRWLQRLGFAQSEQPVYINGFPFYPYVSLRRVYPHYPRRSVGCFIRRRLRLSA